MENSENKMTNSVELNGFAGLNPELVNVSEKNRLVRFTLATNESYKNNNGELVENTTWHKIVMWNKLADQAMTLVKKGSRIALRGRLVNRTYTDKTGIKRMQTEIHATFFETVEKNASVAVKNEEHVL